MKLVLRSDFADYYDAEFDRLETPQVHHVFSRFLRDNTSRKTHLDYLSNSLSLLVPEYGTVREVAKKLRLDQTGKHVVVYTNQFSHMGDGKEKIGLKSALSRYPNHLCSVYMPPDETSTSYSLVGIGEKRFMLKYSSNHKWKSNVGEVSVSSVETNAGEIKSEYHPIFSIDFVVSGGIPYAIDFNPAPRFLETPIRHKVQPYEIIKEIREWKVRSMS